MELLDFPSQHEENAVFRGLMLQEAEEQIQKGTRWVYTQKALEAQQQIIYLASDDIFFFFNCCLWTYDPRPEHAPADKPFCTFPRQDDYLRWLERMYEEPGNVAGFADKARDVGCSYMTIGWDVHHWLFHDSFNAHLGSRKEELVEKRGNPDTLFFKADYMIRNLPPWMLPPGFDINENHRHMIIDRPDNGNTITGESANPDFGRGGRYSTILMDEFGFWQHARAAWESCGESAHFRLAVTTPPRTGKSSHAHKLRSGNAGKVNVFTFDYDSVPWKDAQWLQAAREGKSMEEFNREVLRSYDSSIEGKVYAKEWQLLVKEDNFLEYNPHLPLYLSWDFGLDGVGMIWWQKDFRLNRNYILESYMNKNQRIDFFIPFVTGNIGTSEFNYDKGELDIINRHREWNPKYAGHFGDPDVKKRNLETGKSLKDYMAQAPRNIYVQTHDWSKYTHLQIRELTKITFERTVINPMRNEQLIDAMLNARYPEPREETESSKTTKLPVHDYTSHLRTSYEYYTINEPELPPLYQALDHPAGTEDQKLDQQEQADELSFRSLA